MLRLFCLKSDLGRYVIFVLVNYGFGSWGEEGRLFKGIDCVGNYLKVLIFFLSGLV